MVAMVNTKATAALIPIAVSTFLDTPRNGQIPRNCDNTMLFTKIAEININIYSIFFSYLIELGFLETVNQRYEVSQSDESARSQYKHQHPIFFRHDGQIEDFTGSQKLADSTQ